MKSLSLVLMIACLISVSAAAEDPPEFLTSPDGESTVRIAKRAMPGTDGVSDFFTLEVLRGGKVVVQAPTEGYLMGAHWSEDGKLVAITNRRGNSGDYLWVIDVEDGRVLKRPEDKLGDSLVKWALGQIRQSSESADPMKYWLTAESWTSERTLRFNLRARYPSGAAFDAAGSVDFSSGKAGKPSGATVTTVE